MDADSKGRVQVTAENSGGGSDLHIVRSLQEGHRGCLPCGCAFTSKPKCGRPVVLGLSAVSSTNCPCDSDNPCVAPSLWTSSVTPGGWTDRLTTLGTAHVLAGRCSHVRRWRNGAVWGVDSCLSHSSPTPVPFLRGCALPGRVCRAPDPPSFLRVCLF